MPFPYYQRLSAANKRIYRKSDAIEKVPLPNAHRLGELVEAVSNALESEGRAITQVTCGALTAALMRDLNVPEVKVKVMAARPHDTGGELHGLYSRPADGGPATITVWMRTARRRQVVSFRTFLRTLIHEILHHLDYELFGLADSFHTAGFFKRESSMVRQLAGPGRAASARTDT